MPCRIEFAPRAARQFTALTKQVRTRLIPRINALAEDPRPSGVRTLSDADDLCRLRVGDYRIIYSIQDQRLLVLVLKIGHRRNRVPGSACVMTSPA